MNNALYELIGVVLLIFGLMVFLLLIFCVIMPIGMWIEKKMKEKLGV